VRLSAKFRLARCKKAVALSRFAAAQEVVVDDSVLVVSRLAVA
jgi:hypothetical protein